MPAVVLVVTVGVDPLFVVVLAVTVAVVLGLAIVPVLELVVSVGFDSVSD